MTEVEDPTIAFPPRTVQQKLAAAVILVSLGVVGLAQRDLSRRAPEEIRGSKLAWRIGSSNALVAVIYLRAGRRPAAA